MNRLPSVSRIFFHRIHFFHIRFFVLILLSIINIQQLEADSIDWKNEYSGNAASGPNVVAIWQFNKNSKLKDSSGNNHHGILNGATISSSGIFGGCLESTNTFPDLASPHYIRINHNPELSLTGAFTIEMWLKLKPESPNKNSSYLIDKKYASHHGYQILLDQLKEPNQFQFRTVLGFGNSSKSFFSNNIILKTGEWNHFAFTYDGKGKGSFLLNGLPVGNSFYANHGSISSGNQPVTIGDRNGSNYGSFHGFIDQVRLSRGVLYFQSLQIEINRSRTAFRRMELIPDTHIRIKNRSQKTLKDLQVGFSIEKKLIKHIPIKLLSPGEQIDITFSIPTNLKPGEYQSSIQIKQKGTIEILIDQPVPFTIIRRNLPHKMPVVMWGIGGIEGVTEQFPKLKEIGFTHFLGLRLDYHKIWKEQKASVAINEPTLKKAEKLLDEAFKNNLGIILSMSPHALLDSKEKYLRLNHNGKPYKRPNINGLHPEIQEYFYNSGKSAFLTYEKYPAFSGALIESEIRDGSQLSFTDIDFKAYKKATGFDFPELALHKRGVKFTNLKDFPKNRVIKDNNELLRFYKWFWKEGDAWNILNSQIQKGLKTSKRKDLWTFFDPAVRVPSIYGSGGNVDFISHWTYTYPDPIRIGLCTDELLAMAKGAKQPQNIMKMTQIIWYRSSTAPKSVTDKSKSAQDHWSDLDPGADYITIAPTHLREALFIKLSRAIKGIMYHGWQSLVPTKGHSAYRYTNPETQHELKRLIENIVKPFGPMLLQIPEAPKKIAFLESFSSQMFANRGTYGWGGGWGADAWHVLQYAQLHPEIIYDETVIQNGLGQYKVLALFDCDVLTETVVKNILQFQKRGGIVVADNRLCPAIQADIKITPYFRIKDIQKDNENLHRIATSLRSQLKSRFQSYISADNQNVLTYHREADQTKYIFIVNNKREAGDYVGRFNRVLERGIPTETTITLNQSEGVIYDIINGEMIETIKNQKNQIEIPLILGPGEGQILMITPKPVHKIMITNKNKVTKGNSLSSSIQILDNDDEPFPGVIPVYVSIIDPNGQEAEFSGYYGAAGGNIDLKLDLAPNDASGMWEIRVRDLASRKSGRSFFRVE